MDFLTRHVPGIREIPQEDLTIDAEDAAVVYYRVSDRSQVETDYDPEGNSLPTQREYVQETARRLKKTIVGEYLEPGVSALPIDKRPAFREMIDRIINQRDAKYIIVYMLNRFARNRYEDAIVGLTLERLGVTVISAKEHIHGNDPSQRMMRGMLAVINQYQSEASSADIKEKLAHKAKKGGTIGHAPIGYLDVKEEFEGRKVNTVAVDPDRGTYITHMAELYATGRYSFAEIRQILTEQGLRTRPTKKYPAGTPISIGSIGKILSDRYYCGYITHNNIEYKGRHTPLIPEELFEQVQQVLATTGHSGIRRRVHHHPLKGLLWCTRCKKRFVLSQNTGNGGTYLYLFCMGRRAGTCDMPYLRLDGPNGVEHAISLHYNTVTLDDHTRHDLTEHVDKAIHAEQSLSDHLRAQLTKKLTQLETRENGLFALVGHPEWDQTKLNQQMRHLRAEKTATQHQLADMDTALETGRELFLTGLNMLANPRHVYDSGPDEIKTLLTKTIFPKLYLDADPHGHATITDTQVAEPFTDILNTGLQLAQTITPHQPHHGDTHGLTAHLAPWQPTNPTHTTGDDAPPTRDTTPRYKIISSATLTTGASGSNKPCLVGVAGFEPTASSSRSNPGGHALIWVKPNRGSLFLTCANALSGSR
jgi:DNA invertase Pin-like site-specific DNA recombinase